MGYIFSISLPYLAVYCARSSGPSVTSGQLHPPLEEEENDDLPKHSESMLNQQKLSGGWQGFFLSSSSRCFDDELCFAVRVRIFVVCSR